MFQDLEIAEDSGANLGISEDQSEDESSCTSRESTEADSSSNTRELIEIPKIAQLQPSEFSVSRKYAAGGALLLVVVLLSSVGGYLFFKTETKTGTGAKTEL